MGGTLNLGAKSLPGVYSHACRNLLRLLEVEWELLVGVAWRLAIICSGNDLLKQLECSLTG